MSSEKPPVVDGESRPTTTGEPPALGTPVTPVPHPMNPSQQQDTHYGSEGASEKPHGTSLSKAESSVADTSFTLQDTTSGPGVPSTGPTIQYAEPILLKNAPYPRRDMRTRQSVSALESGTGMPRTRTLQYARTLSIQPEATQRSGDLSRMRTIERQNTVSLSTGPTRGDTAARVVADFRTLSIHVTDTKRGHETDKAAKKEKEKEVKELVNLDYHHVTADELLSRFSSSAKFGLDAEQAARRLQQNGPNRISPPKTNYLKKYGGYIFGGFGTLLFGGAILAFISWKPLGEPAPQASNLALAVILLIVIVLQTVFNAWQDFSTSRTMASISGMLPTEVLALRDGREQLVPAESLVTGDIVRIRLGDKVPADMRFLEVSSDLKVDRSVLTGESEPISASVNETDPNFLETRNVALQGTLVVGGAGWGLVVQTGDNTVFGRIAKLSTGDRQQPTTLQVEITRFVYLICTLAAIIALAVVIAWAAWLNRDHNGFITSSNLVIDVVSVAIAFIPEGLPFAVTLSLSIIAGRLAKEKVLCKTLPIVESLGCVSVLCSDKTGTLTKNVMTVTNFSLLDAEFPTLEGRDLIVANKGGRTEAVRALAAVAGVCNGATFDPTTMDRPVEARLVNGDATDSAILRFAELLRPVASSNSEWTELFKQAFNSKTKYMLKILAPVDAANVQPPAHQDDLSHDPLVLMCKGAPDVLMARCSFVMDADGNRLPFDDATRARLVAKQEEWAGKGQRVLLLASKTLNRTDLPKELAMDAPEFADYVSTDLNHGLTICGLVGLVDPPKDDIPATVAILRDAYIRMFMVTGDFVLTAVAIAEQIGIVTNAKTIHHFEDLDRDIDVEKVVKYDVDARTDIPTAIALTGNDLMKMNDSQWEQACQYEEIVFARTTPEQKLRIVKEFQARGAVVAMTGDGVNDAPSLKAANVGLAVGSQASDVAIEAADLVLLEDFSAIVAGLEYGRLCFLNLRASILYLLPAGSFSELIPLLLNVFIGVPQVISNIQMLLICCLSDLFMSVALCYERPESGLLQRKPRDTKKDWLVDWKLMLQAYSIGIIECLCASSMAFWYMQRNGVAFSDISIKYGTWGGGLSNDYVAEVTNQAQSIYYWTLVVMQWFNALGVRTRTLSVFQHPPIFNSQTSNYKIVYATFASAAVALFFLYVPVWQHIFLTRSVDVEYIFIPFALGAGLLLLEEARKFWIRRSPNGFLAKIAW